MDVANILKAMPDFVPTKCEESSLYLYSAKSGARAHTAAHVRLKDLIEVRVVPTEDDDEWYNIVVMK